MDLLKFIFFSSLEYFSAFVFILIQFRFSLRENIEKITLISILLSFVSYSLIQADLRDISPLIQNVIFLIYIWVVLKVSLPNSFIMLLTGYTVFGLVQTCIQAVYAQLGFIAGEPGANLTYQVQIISSSTMIVLSFVTYTLNGGFSFIGTRGRAAKKQLSNRYKLFIVYIIMAFLVTLVTNIYLLNHDRPSYPMSVGVLVLVLILLFYFSFKRDESVD